MIDEALLACVRCPASGQALVVAPAGLTDNLNQLIAQQQLRDQTDALVEQPMEQALLTADRTRVYPVRDGIPALIPSEAIPVPSQFQ